jgi:hypothetical protein
MSTKERASIAGKARAAKLSPERRSEIASKASLASSVAAIVKRVPELTEDQVAALHSALAPRFEHGETPHVP